MSFAIEKKKLVCLEILRHCRSEKTPSMDHDSVQSLTLTKEGLRFVTHAIATNPALSSGLCLPNPCVYLQVRAE